jgi:hypothetical protein
MWNSARNLVLVLSEAVLVLGLDGEHRVKSFECGQRRERLISSTTCHSYWRAPI